MFPYKKRMIREYEEQKKSHEPFRGVVAVVQVCSGYRELVLKAALEKLGATVTPIWGITVTHFVWSYGGCCNVETQSQLLNCSMMSPLYVDVCIAPSTSRNPDLPLATELLRYLKAAEESEQRASEVERELRGKENSNHENQSSSLMSSDFDNNTTSKISEGKTQDMTQDAEKSNDVKNMNNTTLVEAPPKAVFLIPITPEPAAEPFTAIVDEEDDSQLVSDEQNTSLHVTQEKPHSTAVRNHKKAHLQKVPHHVETQSHSTSSSSTLKLKHNHYREKKRNLNKRIAKKRMMPTQTQHARNSYVPRIVLTGMPKSQKQAVLVAIKSLNGKVQKNVDKYTTHVLLGLCKEDVNTTCCSVSNVDRSVTYNDNKHMSNSCSGIVNEKQMRTVKTLLGAVRGCWVLQAQWALDSQKAKKWLPHSNYEVKHLQNIAQTARVERISFGKIRKNYNYNVFQGKWVCISKTAEKRDAAIQLLTECGGHIINYITNTQDFYRNTQCNQHGGVTQNGGAKKRNARKAVENCDIIRISSDPNEVSSLWVFDSVVAGRPRTTHRYVNKKINREISISS